LSPPKEALDPLKNYPFPNRLTLHLPCTFFWTWSKIFFPDQLTLHFSQRTYPALLPTNLPCTYPALFFGLGEKKKKKLPDQLTLHISQRTYPALPFGLGQKKKYSRPCTFAHDPRCHLVAALLKSSGFAPYGALHNQGVGRALGGKSRRRRAYPQQIVTTRLLYCLQDPFAQLSRLQRI
jgi:hypothetical protein